MNFMKNIIFKRLIQSIQHHRPSYQTCHFHCRHVSHNVSSLPKHIVYVSNSKCIFENLALEDWLYENSDLENENILLMWRNKPTVVIGRHQNMWKECDVSYAMSESVDLARRKSGGGAVFHDEGNLNLSFIKCRSRYHRRTNLELVVEAVASEWNIDLAINKREDIILDGLFKISGTASKLAAKRTYHHFTLLCDVDVDRLNTLLHSPLMGIESKSTESVRANVRNLVEVAPTLDFPALVNCIGSAFLNSRQVQGDDIHFMDYIREEEFPGWKEKVSELKDWEWNFGKTPPFKISRSFTTTLKGHQLGLHLKIHIAKGRVEKLETELIDETDKSLNIDSSRIGLHILIGARLINEELLPLLNLLQDETHTASSRIDSLQLRWIVQCMKQCLVV